MSNEPVVHFERGDRHQYATVLESQDPPVFSHHCIHNEEEFSMPASFYEYNQNNQMTPEEFIEFLVQAGVNCTPQ